MTAHAPARINPDTKHALILATIATGLLASISFILSFAGLSAIASWAAVPHGLRGLVPGFIDGAILVYTYSALAARARGEDTHRPWTWVALWTAVSALANASHAIATSGQTGLPLVVGGVLAALFPVGSLLATHEIADRMIARPDAVLSTPRPTVAEAPRPRRHLGRVFEELGRAGRGPARPARPRPVQASPSPRRSASRLSDEQVAEIARLDAEGLRLREIEDRTGIPKSTVHTNLKRLKAARPTAAPTFVDVPLPLDGPEPASN